MDSLERTMGYCAPWRGRMPHVFCLLSFRKDISVGYEVSDNSILS